MDNMEKLKAEVCSLLDYHNFWQAIQTIQNAMIEGNFSPCETDLEEETRTPGVLE